MLRAEAGRLLCLPRVLRTLMKSVPTVGLKARCNDDTPCNLPYFKSSIRLATPAITNLALRMKPFLFTLITLLSWPLIAQEDQPFEIEHIITSEAFGAERKITVYLPPAYYRRPDTKYTITYVLDGQYGPFIDLVVKTIEYNVNARKITPTILVGIHSENRGAEFSMPNADDEYQDGRAPALQAHLRNEVIPLVESLYPEAEDFRSILGHSSGGAFVLHSLFNDADLFDGYIAISPALRPGRNTILADAETHLKAGKTYPRFLYCSAGTVGEREELFGGAIDKLDALLERFPNHGLIWKQNRFEGLDHWSVVGPSVVDGEMEQTRAFCADVKTVVDFAQHPSKGLVEQLEGFYASRQSDYGFTDLPPDGYLYNVAKELVRVGKGGKALKFYDWALAQYKDSYLLTKYKAVLLMDRGDKKAAHAGFVSCMELLMRLKDELSEEKFNDRKEDLEGRLAASR